jgi:hypothetical protein
MALTVPEAKQRRDASGLRMGGSVFDASF